MKRLLQIELLKLRNYKAFWILIGLYGLALILTLWFSEVLVNSMIDGGPGGMMYLDVNSFPDNWHHMTYLAGFFTYILTIVVVLLVSSEFTYKTIRQNVINGLSPMEFLSAKLLLILFMTTACTFIVGFSIVALGIIDGGFFTLGWMFGKSYFLLGYFIQTLGYLMFAFWLTLLIKRSGIAIGILFIYTWFIENILGAIFGFDYTRWLPIRSFNVLIEMPFKAILSGGDLPAPTILEFLIPVGYLILFFGMSAWMMTRRDL